MCDYSLMHVKSRAAAVGDELVTAGFSNSPSHGFISPSDPATAVCVLPGTEIAFAENVQTRGPYLSGGQIHPHSVARFRQVKLDIPNTYHDALEFPDGTQVMLHTLVEGQIATILQLPAAPKTEAEAKEQQRLEYVS